MADRRIIIVGVLMISFLVSPLYLPTAVKDRIMYTFTQPEEKGQVKIGDIRLDTSTSARLVSWKEAIQDFPKHPLLGYGITGYNFVDAQFPRVLVETGILGLMAFCYLIFSIFKVTLNNLKAIKTPYFQGLAYGFIAGFVGLIVHALGANTFIIVRIMEPFWFFAGIMVVMPVMEGGQVAETESVVARGKALAAGS
jgi:O-antigen ligase